MAPRRENILEVINLLAKQENLSVTISQSAKGAIAAFSGAFLGGLLGGPIGLAIGGTVGSITAAWYGKENFKSIINVIEEDMTEVQRIGLANAVHNVISDIDIQDVTMLLAFLIKTPTLKEAVIKEIGTYLFRELQMQINQ